MTTTNPQIVAAARQQAALIHHARTHVAVPPEPDPALATAARRPEADPCDVACDAMPGFVIGDLNRPDMSWLLAHTAECRYCASMLDRYERLDEVLDRLGDIGQTPPPPPVIHALHASYALVETPIGPLFVAVTDQGVCDICFASSMTEEEFRRAMERRGMWPVPNADAVSNVSEQLGEYFAGKRSRFQVPLDYLGLTPFTKSVLKATAEVPFGQLSTYRQIAERVGSPRATRAVGNALHRNPIPLIVPCHRIVRSDASIGGYGGGVAVKQQLLHLEGAAID